MMGGGGQGAGPAPAQDHAEEPGLVTGDSGCPWDVWQARSYVHVGRPLKTEGPSWWQQSHMRLLPR